MRVLPKMKTIPHIDNDPRYKNWYKAPIEVWDEAHCAKMVKARWKDGMGTYHPSKGVVSVPTSTRTRCFINEESYEGILYKDPILAPGYKWVDMITWNGLKQIVKE